MTDKELTDAATRPTPKSARFDSIDLLKGLALLSMAGLHTAIYLRVLPVTFLFGPTDSFIFPTFLFCFAFGNGLSARPKRLDALAKLALAYVGGGLLTTFAIEVSRDSKHGVDRWLIEAREALLLHDRFRGTDFLFPFVVLFVMLMAVQRAFRTWSAPVAVWTALGSILLLALGVALAPYERELPYRAFLDGFKILQSVPLFATGLLLGLYARELRPPLKFPPYAFLAVGLALCTVVVIAYARTRHPSIGEKVWKLSSGPSYPAVTVIASLLSFLAAEGIVRSRACRYFRAIAKIGSRAFLCLWIQFAVLSVFALIGGWSGTPLVRLGLAISTVPLVGALTLAYPQRPRTSVGSVPQSTDGNLITR